MARVLNEGLEAGDFKYYIAAGRSAEQLAGYEADMFEFARDTQQYMQRRHADMAVTTERRFRTEVLGLRFNTHAAPEGWKDDALGTKSPARHGREKLDFENLWVNRAHMYLGAMPKGENEGRCLVPVVMPLQDKWIIASPVVGGQAFAPMDAVGIDPATYATLTSQDPAALKSPATDPAYTSDFLKAFPFRPAASAAPAATVS